MSRPRSSLAATVEVDLMINDIRYSMNIRSIGNVIRSALLRSHSMADMRVVDLEILQHLLGRHAIQDIMVVSLRRDGS